MGEQHDYINGTTQAIEGLHEVRTQHVEITIDINVGRSNLGFPNMSPQ